MGPAASRIGSRPGAQALCVLLFSAPPPARHATNRLNEALADFSAAIETDPSSSLSFNSRALLLERLGQPAAAMADHDAAVGLDPRDAGYVKSRGLCARGLGQYETAVRDFTR
jgi:Tfp pilus assembly protein PilF